MSVHFSYSECVFIGEIVAKNFYPCQEYSTILDSLTLIRISDVCCFMQWNAVVIQFYYVYDYESCFLMLYDPFFHSQMRPFKTFNSRLYSMKTITPLSFFYYCNFLTFPNFGAGNMNESILHSDESDPNYAIL